MQSFYSLLVTVNAISEAGKVRLTAELEKQLKFEVKVKNEIKWPVNYVHAASLKRLVLFVIDRCKFLIIY